MAELNRDAPLGALADELKSQADGQKVSAGDMLDAAGRSAYGPLLMLIALVNISPIGSIPGVAVGSGLLVVVLGGQMLISRGALWVPSWVERKTVESARVRKALEKVRPVLDWIDRIPRPRLQYLTQGAWAHGAGVGVIVMGLIMFPMALVPWGVLAPAIPLLVLGLALMARDGLLMAVALAMMVAAVAVSGYLAYATFAGQ